jgi:flavorubredoxin
MHDPRWLDSDIAVLPSSLEVPAAGTLAVNASLIRSPQPVLVDTGLAALGAEFLATLESLIDPVDLRWIWITHTDADHVGNLRRVLERAPSARLVINFLGMAKLDLLGLPTDRVHLLNPGQTLDVGDRKLLAVQPPVYDAPETMAVFDTMSRTLFSADSFGGLLQGMVEDAQEIPDEELRQGMLAWSRVDAPWLGDIDPARFARNLESVRDLDPDMLVSSHLPPARRMLDTLIAHLKDAPHAAPFVGPDQAAFEAMMTQA